MILTLLLVMKKWNLVDKYSLFERWQKKKKKIISSASVKMFKMPKSMVSAIV